MDYNDNEITMECLNCDWCDSQCDVDTQYADRMYSKYGGFFCSEDCKSDWVHAEFDHMMQSNEMR